MAARSVGKMLTRLFRLWGVYAYLDFVWAVRGFKQFLLWYLSDAVLQAASITGMFLLAERFAGIGVWNRTQILFMLGYASAASGIVAVFFSFNIMFISRRLGRGQLDHTLIQPLPLWLSLLTEGFAPISASSILLPGVGLMVWATVRLALHVTPGWLALLLLNLFASATVLLAFQFLWGSAAFWAPRGAEEISSSSNKMMSQLKAFPLDGLGTLMTGGLLSALPVGFLGWFPCRALLGLERASWKVWGTPLAALVLSLLAAAVFRRGLQHYARVGSQRYSAFGFRC